MRPRLSIALGTLILAGGCEELLDQMSSELEGEARPVDRPAASAPEGPAPPSSGPEPVITVAEQARQLGLRPLPDGRFVDEAEDGRRRATIAADGSVSFERARPDSPRPGVALPGAGQLGRPQPTAEQTQFLEATADLRARLEAEAARKNVNKQLATLRDDLRRIWTDKNRSAEERRQVLFQRWDETFGEDDAQAVEAADPSARALARTRVEAAAAARAQIEAFVREHLPQGSPDGYGEAELEKLNAGRSAGRRFAPYTVTEEP